MEEINNQVQTNEPIANEPKEDSAEVKILKAEIEKLKKAQSNASSDAAEWKRKFRETQSEQERLEAERVEREAQINAELKAYKDKDRISNYALRLQEAGYDSESAKKMAVELPEGITDSFFESQKLFLENQKKTMEANALNKQPGITPGTAPSQQMIEEQEKAKLRKYFGL